MVDYAADWSPCGAWVGGTVGALALSPNFAHDGLLLAATSAGLFRSCDGGLHWQLAATGFSDPRLIAVAFAPVVPALLAFAATADGRLFQSEDSGVTWRECGGWAGLGLIKVLCISPNFADDHTLFVATAEGVFRSQDGGASWESSTFGLFDLEILCLACAPNFAENDLLWAGSALGGFYRSRNGARSWRDSGLGLPDMAVQCMAVSPDYAHDQTLYVGTERDGIYWSSDGGATWQALSAALMGQSINALTISPDGQTLFAGTGDGVYCSRDGGRHWTLTAGGDFLALTLTIAGDGTAVAGAYQDGILRWSAPAQQWQAALTGLTAHVPPSVWLNQAHILTLLDVEGALVQSQDEGCTWQLLNQALADEAVLALTQATDAHGSWLYAATATALYGKHVAPADQAAADWQAYALPAEAAAPTLLAAAPALALPPQLLLADEHGHLFLSADGGAHWQTLTTPWPSSQPLQIAFSPVDRVQQTLIAMTVQPHPEQHYLLQLWQSSDLGREWIVLADFYADTPAAVMTLPLDPVEQPILVGVHNRLIKLYQTATYTWMVQQHFLAAAQRITSIVTTPAYLEEQTIFITTNDGLLQSNDGGVSWAVRGDGLAGHTLVAFCPGTQGRPSYAVELGGVIWRREER